MSPNLSNKARQYKLSRSPVREIMSYADPEYIRGLGVDPERLISFAGGWVNHKAPDELRDAYDEIVQDKILFHKSGAYPHPLGDVSFRAAIVEFEQHIYGIDSLDINQIGVGLGSTQLANALFEMLLDPNDTVLLLDPTYCNYPTQLRNSVANLNIIRLPVLDEGSWHYSPDDKCDEVVKLITKNKPKLTLLITPDNPTGQVLSDRFVETVAHAMREVNGFLIIDYAYKELIFGDHVPEYYSWGPTENIIFLRSSSKWGRNLGRRLAWVEAPSSIIEVLESFQGTAILCPDMLHQLAMTIYMQRAIKNNTLRGYIEETKGAYQRAAKQTMSSINNWLGYPALEPMGGLFTCMSVDIDGARFVRETLKASEVLFVPGYGFGKTLQHAVRVSFGPLVNDCDVIEQGIRRVGEST